jgi:DNA invertase Pin-like site-specific DNA recombinase
MYTLRTPQRSPSSAAEPPPAARLRIGYARVSTDAQDLTAQRDALAALGVAPERTYVDHGLTGTSRARPGLREALAACRAGDEFVVTKLDRLARSVPDARDIADELTARQVKLNLGGAVYDPTDPVGRLLFTTLAMVAEFEADLIRARTREGMKVAKAKGRLRGKQPKLTARQQAHLVRITTDDVRTINQTMRARSPHMVWEVLTGAGRLPWLAALDPSWDLVELPDREWERFGCTALLTAAFTAAIAPHRQLAGATKMLHLKRPSLFPILDTLVVEQIGGARRSPIDLLLHLRAEAQRNRLALHEVQSNLQTAQITRTLARILDALLWSSHPAAAIAMALTGWERVIRPAPRTAPGIRSDVPQPGRPRDHR